MAARVLPSPVFISAILPSWSTTPPMIWTSKWRKPSVRLEASRTAAKASERMSSRSSPSASRALNSSVLARKASSENSSNSDSHEAAASTSGRRRLRTLSPPPVMRFAIVFSMGHSFRKPGRMCRSLLVYYNEWGEDVGWHKVRATLTEWFELFGNREVESRFPPAENRYNDGRNRLHRMKYPRDYRLSHSYLSSLAPNPA